MTRRLVLVTGASAGIGAEFARAYAKAGWDLALTARRADRLAALATELEAAHSVAAFTVSADLSEPGATEAIMDAMAQRGRHLDGMVNNAGYSLPNGFADTSWEDQERLIRVLYTAPVELVHRALPGMLERGFGRIINVASLVAYGPGTLGRTLYGSLKSGLIKFSESLNDECKGTGVHCTALCPGLTRSEFHAANGMEDRMNSMPGALWMGAGPVVKAGMRAVDKGQPVCVPGLVNKGLATATKLIPEPIARAMVRRR